MIRSNAMSVTAMAIMLSSLLSMLTGMQGIGADASAKRS